MNILGQLHVLRVTLIGTFLTLICACKSAEDFDANQQESQVRRAVSDMSKLAEDLHGNRSKTDYDKKYLALLQYAKALDESKKAEIYKVFSVRIVTIPAKPFPEPIEHRERISWDSIDAILATTNSKELIREIITTTPPYQVGNESIRDYLERHGIGREQMTILVTKCKSHGARTFIEGQIREYDRQGVDLD